jgi:cyclic pyranopterin phosphate synthase
MIYDPYGRPIYYLRISVTDRCNLRCRYCMPDRFKKLPHSEILRYEEIIHFIKIVSSMGFYKIRVTGGEPLIRSNITLLIQQMSKIPGIKDLSITTNGTLLAEMAKDLFDAGLRRINISLDTLNPEKYRYITHVNAFSYVWQGIEKALEIGFSPVKVNTVLLKGFNDDEILDLAKLAFDYPIHIRFIEYMPLSSKTLNHREYFLSADAVKERLTGLGKLQPLPSASLDGPVKRYKISGGLGEIGLIAALSHSFCHRCNRIRLTSDGKLRPCLFSDKEWDIKTPLRKGESIAVIKSIVKKAIAHKPKGHNYVKSTGHRPMFRIGG